MTDEPALVVGYFDIVKLLFFTMFIFVILAPLMDAGYLYIHHAPSNYYNTTDVQAVDDLYNIYRFIPIAAVVTALFFIINYSNIKKSE